MLKLYSELNIYRIKNKHLKNIQFIILKKSEKIRKNNKNTSDKGQYIVKKQ